MSTARQNLLPFDQLDDKQFESFLLQFLGAGISLEVIERLPVTELAEPDLVKPSYSTARYRIIRAIPPAGFGQKQHGVDIVAYTESGAQWVFQCKHWPKKKFDVAAATEVMRKAQTEYPEASRYFVALSHPATKPVEVRRIVEANPKWQLWEPSEIWTRFRNEVPNEKQIDLVRRFFDEDTVKQLYPLQHDSLLLSAGDFFARSSPINFGTTFVGREAELAQLLAFARASGPAAAILSAPGGIGKTRLLREFAERLAAESPDLRVLFLNPAASAQANTDGLRAAQEGKLVVVFDDAHRSETLRKDIARSVSAKKGRLLLAARPQSVEALRVWSADHGFTANEPIGLPPLDDALLQRIAATELGAELAHHAGRIVALADHNALLVTVAAELLKQEPQSAIDSLLASENFGRRILDRLADKTLDSVFSDHAQRERAREVLHVLAILAPWTVEVFPLDRIAAVLDCGEREFVRVRDALLAARLVVRTGRGLRVVPDLLADHLVRQACFEPGPERRLTPLAEAIQKAFAPAISCTTGLHVIRNLAEAEAQQGDAEGKLVEPFWNEFKRQYLDANHGMRAHLLHEWSSFAIHQPARSLALAKLAVETAETPGTVGVVPDDILESVSPATAGRVLAAAATLLEPVAARCSAQRFAAFDLLWTLEQRTAAAVAPSTSPALDALGHVANWTNHQRLDAVRDLLAWLATQLGSTEGAERLLRRRSPALSVLLKPVFECSYDWIESDPASTEARLVALPGADIEPLYTAALNVIEQQVLPSGEVAILNIHGALESTLAATPHYGRLRALPESLRLRSLKLVSTLIANQPSPRVLFRFRETLRGILKREPPGIFRDEVQTAHDSIPDSADLRLAIVLRSNRWTEFFQLLPFEEQQSSLRIDLYQTKWLQLTDTVARNLATQFTTGPSLFAELERIGGDYLSVGETPDFSELLAGFSRVAPSLAIGVFGPAVGRLRTTFDRSLFSLVPALTECDASSLLRQIELILDTPNPERWSAFLSWLSWHGADRITPELLTHIAAWAAQLDDDAVHSVLPHLSLSGAPASRVGETILEHLALARLSEGCIAALCQRLGELGRETDHLSIPPGFRVRFIAELHRLDRFEVRFAPSCFPVLSQEEPRRFFEMLQRRVREAAERKNPFPLGLDEVLPLNELAKESDYPDIARSLLGEVRNSDKTSTRHWTTLFQWAVLRVSPLGLTLLGEWLNETRDADELGRLIRCLRFNGSTIVFKQPDFVRNILARIRTIAPTKAEDLRALLASTGSPTSWGLSNGEPNPETRRYREQAAKAAAIHATDSDLATFYRLIVEQEDAHAAFLHRSYEQDDEWSY